MHWADQIADNIIKSKQHQPYWVDDMKTPSGRVHVGALRGVLVHDLVYKALKSRGVEAHYTYVFNDMDPMDSLPGYLNESAYGQHMGAPLYKIPAPDGISKNFATQYANDFINSFSKLGAEPEIIWSHQLYESGKMNDHIKTALDRVDQIRDVYLQVAKQQKPNNWYPFQVICPQCGKVGSTLVDGWDGEKVSFTCMPEMVTWAKGCGYQGTISPFNGTGKLMWKVDWPAHWKAIGVTIEGAGKDHSSDGGSRDIAKALLKEVFDFPNPFDIPYEWFLVGGHKMSSSKGVGTTAKDFVEMIPPVIGRFLFVRTKFNRQLNFDPSGDTIPDLFDEYDRMAKAYWSGQDSDYSRIFELSQIGSIPKAHFLPRFRDIARMIQDPKIDLYAKVAEQKGEALTTADKEEIDQRLPYVNIWLQRYAPKDDVIELIDQPAVTLTPIQHKYLEGVYELLNEKPTDPEQFQQQLYQLTKKIPIPAKEAFSLIYQIMIGKTHGPKAAWFLLEHADHAIKVIANTLKDNGGIDD